MSRFSLLSLLCLVPALYAEQKPAASTAGASATSPTADKAAAAKPAKAPDFVRLVEEETESSLQTAIARYRTKDGVEVDLIGAVHIADKAYYDQLNARFKTYDAVLYELVGDPARVAELQSGKAATTTPAKPSEANASLAVIGQLHTTLRDTLKLTGQLEGIDYKAKNFVHADMSTTQFSGAKEKKQESFAGLIFKAWAVQMELKDRGEAAPEADLFTLLSILSKKEKSGDLKLLLARQFDTIELLMTGIESGDGTVIIGERNRVALEQLDKEIAKGHKRLAIFYGAAHLIDMETRLKARGWEKTGVEWLKAWEIKAE